MVIKMKLSEKLDRLVVYSFRYKGISYKWNDDILKYKSLDNKLTMSENMFDKLFNENNSDLITCNIK